MRFQGPGSYREYYRLVCKGDTRALLEGSSYEAPRIQWLLSRCKGSVLDVGCCTGDFAACLQSRGFDVVGVDPSVEHVRIARERYPGLRIFEGFIEDLQDLYFDTIVCGDVLEHVPDDHALVAKLVKLGNSVFLTTPLGFWNSPEHLRDYTIDMATAVVQPYGGAVTVLKDEDGYDRWLGLSIEPKPEPR